MSIIAGVLSSVAGSVAGSLMNKGGSAPNSSAAGLDSAMQGSNTPPPATPAKTSAFGSQAMDLMKETIGEMAGGAKSAVTDGIGSMIANKLSGGAGGQGRDARAYMDAMFPELNPWEKAGSGATGGANADSEQTNAYKLKKMELDNAKDIAKIQSYTAIKTTQMNNSTAQGMNDANLQPVIAKLGPELDKLTAEISQIKASTSLTAAQKQVAVNAAVTEIAKAKNLDVNSVKAAAETNAVNTSRSVAGGIAHDLDYWGNELTDRAIDYGSKAWDGLKSTGTAIKNRAEEWKKNKKLTITVNPKM